MRLLSAAAAAAVVVVVLLFDSTVATEPEQPASRRPQWLNPVSCDVRREGEVNENELILKFNQKERKPGGEYARQPRQTSRLRIAAFNIRHLTCTKVTNSTIRKIIAQILFQFDVTFVQEIRCNICFHLVLDELNSISLTRKFDLKLSDGLGKENSRYQEYYAYVYSGLVNLIASCQWPWSMPSRNRGNACVQNTSMVFSRPPFIANFRSAVNGFTFGFIGIHTPPANASNETKQLREVYDEMATDWHQDEFILGGDFNTRQTVNLREPRILGPTRFLWVINDNISTMVDSGNANDRLVLAGTSLHQKLDEKGVFKYSNMLDVTIPMTRAVSDHWPVFLTLRLSENDETHDEIHDDLR